MMSPYNDIKMTQYFYLYVMTLVRTDTSASTTTLARTYTSTNKEVLTGDVEDVHDRDNNAPKVYSKVHHCP